MTYLQKKVDTHDVSEERLSELWDGLSSAEREKWFRCLKTHPSDMDLGEEVYGMELGYVSEQCSQPMLQAIVNRLWKIATGELVLVEGAIVL